MLPKPCSLLGMFSHSACLTLLRCQSHKAAFPSSWSVPLRLAEPLLSLVALSFALMKRLTA